MPLCGGRLILHILSYTYRTFLHHWRKTMAAKKPSKTEDKVEAAVKAPKAPKAPKPPKEVVVKDTQHNVTRPKAGTSTGKVWEVSDDISRSTKAPAKRAAVIEACTAAGINAATAATQYGRWRTYNGLGKEEKAVAAAE